MRYCAIIPSHCFAINGLLWVASIWNSFSLWLIRYIGLGTYICGPKKFLDLRNEMLIAGNVLFLELHILLMSLSLCLCDMMLFYPYSDFGYDMWYLLSQLQTTMIIIQLLVCKYLCVIHQVAKWVEFRCLIMYLVVQFQIVRHDRTIDQISPIVESCWPNYRSLWLSHMLGGLDEPCKKHIFEPKTDHLSNFH